MTRFIGRFRRESSPVILVVKDWPERMPDRRRIVVPEFSASSARRELLRPWRPWPVIWAVEPLSATPAPRALTQARVLRQSRAAAKLRSSLAPSARAASMAYRWEMDLSPGSSRPPERAWMGWMTSDFTMRASLAFEEEISDIGNQIS